MRTPASISTQMALDVRASDDAKTKQLSKARSTTIYSHILHSFQNCLESVGPSVADQLTNPLEKWTPTVSEPALGKKDSPTTQTPREIAALDAVPFAHSRARNLR